MMKAKWTPELVSQLMDSERYERVKAEYVKARPRLEAIKIIRDANENAKAWYLKRFADIQRDMTIGVIGPEEPHSHGEETVWLAREVRRRLLRELEAESPIQERNEL